jgi:ESS family glutamate:Na+ symporter
MGHRNPDERARLSHAGVRLSFLYNMSAELGQYGLAILFGLACLRLLFPSLPSEFAIMLPAGVAGGHGTPAIFGQAFKQGWEDALSVGLAFATIGMATSLLGGMLLVNIAVRCGWTKLIGNHQNTVEREGKSFLPESEQFSIGSATANPTAIDPLLWHIALLGAVIGATVAADWAIHQLILGSYWIPQFAIAMLLGALLQFVLDRVGYGQSVDRATMRRLGSVCADLIVVCGVASIKLSVVWQFAGPIALMSVFGLVYSVAFLLIAPWIFRDYWFERAIFTYGWLTGVLGFSVALLRIVDPKLESNTLEDYGAAYFVIGPVELVLYPIIIWATAVNGQAALGIILTLLAAALLLAARKVPLPLGVAPIKKSLSADVAGRQLV